MMDLQRVKSAFAEILSEWETPKLKTLERDPTIIQLTENLVLKVEAQRNPAQWPVNDYTDEFKDYHPGDHYQWMWLFFHAPFYSAELADVLCFLRCNGSILVQDPTYGYRIEPIIGGHGWKDRQAYDDTKAPLAGYMNEVIALLKNLRIAEQQGKVIPAAAYQQGRLGE
ncbi:hypothetical protein [uncultured Megasphaera sp.]|uniref:hypothetical protein n=1 Tax=uncultured Megasphaera sp. TaxID=165188 RepID=UPI00265AF172|nr:hypothetical protein [uncultured Megasphaera sp.]